MFLLINGILVLLTTSVICQRTTVRFRRTVPRIPDTFKDIFLVRPGFHNRPVLGTMKATCWARGGVCVHIRDCPNLKMDIAVAGCTQNYRVCCQNFKIPPPSVGILRKTGEIGIISSDLDELKEKSIEILAQHNVDLLQQRVT